MAHKVTLIPGDGIGPEVIEATKTVIDAAGVDIKYDVVEAGAGVMEEKGTPLPDEVIESIEENKVGLKGPITTPVGSGFRSVNVAIRQKLKLFANVRPTKNLPGIGVKDSDIVTVRENTEGLYSGVEHYCDEDKSVAESHCIISRKASERVVRFAFEYAEREGREKVTAVHKANILKATNGLFLETAEEVAEEYPDIEFEDRIVDNMAMQLVQKPELYDVLVTTNLFGDILSDLCAGLVGGLGVAPGGNYGHDKAVFEPIHGSAPKYAGQNKVNPTAQILTGTMMLKYLGEDEAAKRIREAVEAAVKEGDKLTYDLGGDAGTQEYAEYVASKL
ncbi:isocitrate/isopropylmalate dehydrogenase family protein [Methanonatronarchaeum sp. AMET6-2]|uniref:isocitrate/isopropylmalate dehydrogenase family protein n=1 Tax=Methanonatronarchaeum sp. AMET6-2 TaxID=2933293 RepID=UPI00122490C1|nr:isocitrate/isopropylmalate dehydrogenase family protein [Methanonatronarchaeum sp. AMET6-2]RZN62332.1 MAG: isocitrate/isopropylmalate dehydrogenase family protein [Methanonatronarchaeia archaeon]UOY09571.1 isocitrate/isopropylmalate dehydrogenase family protein [Methanonatronarchaeum sp. AMET6-2]